jgi:predicted ATP-grasp superfamily ATP-dependent carboligase
VCERVIVAASRAELMDALAEIAHTQVSKSVLFPCLDGKVLTVSRAREQLEDSFHIVLPPADDVEMLMDKSALYRYAMDKGFPIPPTHILGPGEGVDDIAPTLAYPVAVKPAYRNSVWTANTNEKAYRIESAAELSSLFERIRPWADEIIVQGWINGGVSDLYSCNCYFGKNGELLATFIAKKLRQWPPDTGQSSLGVECRNDEVLAESIRLLSSVEYRGLGYVECKRDAVTGDYFIVEPNIGRPTGRSAIAEAGGVELLYTMYCDAVGLPLPDARTQLYGDAKWIHLRRDLQSAFVTWRRGQLGFGEWARSMRGKKAYAVMSFTDPMPFLFDIIDTVRSVIVSRR